eukprot:c12562_g1_i1 orf=2-520(-)
MIAAYAQNGHVEAASTVFYRMPERNVVSWTAMIAAFSQNGHAKDALELFGQMQLEGQKPNKITFISILDACASLTALSEGREIHSRIIDCRLESDVVLGTALVRMYGKCGSPDEARIVFYKMPQRDVFSWTTMIAAYAQIGNGKEVLRLFQQMQLDGVKPNEITFISILSGCS